MQKDAQWAIAIGHARGKVVTGIANSKWDQVLAKVIGKGSYINTHAMVKCEQATKWLLMDQQPMVK